MNEEEQSEEPKFSKFFQTESNHNTERHPSKNEDYKNPEEGKIEDKKESEEEEFIMFR